MLCEEEIGVRYRGIVRGNGFEFVFVGTDEVGPCDNGDEIAVLQHGDPSEVVIYKAAADVGEVVTFFKSQNVGGHIVTDTTGEKLDIVEELKDVFFGDYADKTGAIDDGQTCDIIYYHQMYGFIN